MTKPITKVEKHHLQKLRSQYRNLQNQGDQKELPNNQPKDDDQKQSDLQLTNTDIKIRQLLDIIKIKVKYEKKIPFLQFLMQSFNQIDQRESEAQCMQN